ncbi:rab GTPase-activating protein 1-like isoform X2 [Pseudoliparis swirei]|uniref:rab GTPase-activating protein 1-like isoform X2 n=1 Tax=Pseudoliparis swirei TaxID=2059687 RepID=UPI0024BD6135|nr:rab GTPase-activating protein 1-like isoform X2 [Pseudoliparis swirei]
MMEEVSTIMAYDAQVMEQMSEEEILACLIPATEANLGESRLELMDDDEPLDRYLKENHRLQQAGLRLEQENDNLAHRLISSKVALRNSLNLVEDQVERLTTDLYLTKHRLQATEEEKRGKDEEAAVSKEVFRRELDKVEHEVRRSSGVIADYKQICSQLNQQLEEQQAAHREELDALQSATASCSRCRRLVGPGPPQALGLEEEEKEDAEDGGGLGAAAQRRRAAREKESLGAQIRDLERELAETKVQMVEARCKIQELRHQKGTLANDLREAKGNWVSKAFTSLRPAGAGEPSRRVPPFSGWSAKKLPRPRGRDHREDA